MARRRRFVPPVEAVEGGWRINLDAEERALMVRLVGELRDLLLSDADEVLLERLFPVVHPDDEEMEAEYQRLMREELVASRLAAIETVSTALARDPDDLLAEDETLAFMQSLNAVRLVLGTMLGITDDESAADAESADTPEHQLYVFLSWTLEWTVRALSPD
jgi:hypothetical protein